MNAFWQKFSWTVLAVGVYALAAWPAMAEVAEALKVLAGVVVGAVWLPRPGDGAEMAKLRKSVPPVAGVLCILLLGGCAWWNETGKPIARTILDIGRHLCLLAAEERPAAARDGLSPADFCAVEENLRPFIDEVLAAKQRASGEAGLTSGGEQ